MKKFKMYSVAVAFIFALTIFVSITANSQTDTIDYEQRFKEAEFEIMNMQPEANKVNFKIQIHNKDRFNRGITMVCIGIGTMILTDVLTTHTAFTPDLRRGGRRWGTVFMGIGGAMTIHSLFPSKR